MSKRSMNEINKTSFEQTSMPEVVCIELYVRGFDVSCKYSGLSLLRCLIIRNTAYCDTRSVSKLLYYKLLEICTG